MRRALVAVSAALLVLASAPLDRVGALLDDLSTPSPASAAPAAPILGFDATTLASSAPVPVLVRLDDPGAATLEVAARAAGRPVDAAAVAAAEDRLLRRQDAVLAALATSGVPATLLGRTSYLVSTMRLALPGDRVRTLAGLPGVAEVASDPDRSFLTLDNSVAYTQAPSVHSPPEGSGVPATDGTGRTIAVIDTGIDWTHPMFGGTRTPLEPAGTAPAPAGDGDGCFGPTPAPSCATRNQKVIYQQSFVPGIGGMSAMDDNGHGTHVASTAAGLPVTVDGVRMAGVAPGAALMAIKVLAATGDGNGVLILQAMDEVARDDEDHPRPDVVNMSLGGGEDTTTDNAFAIAADVAVDLGIVMVAANGNAGGDGGDAGRSTISFPANSRKTISVGNSADPGAGAEAQVVGDDRVVPAVAAGNVVGADAFTAPVESLFVDCGGAATPADCGPDAPGKLGLLFMDESPHSAYEQAKQVALRSGVTNVVIVDSDAGADDSPRTITMVDSRPQTFVVSVSYGAHLRTFTTGLGTVSSAPLRFARPPAERFSDFMAESSSQGPLDDWSIKPEVTAPGQSIVAAASFVCAVDLCLDRRDGYASIGGTSMASPHVAGMAALLLVRPGFGPAEVKAALTSTADRLPGDVSIHEQGGGAAKVFDAARTPVVPDPPIVSFGSVATPTADSRVSYRTLTFRDARPAGSAGAVAYALSVTSGRNVPATGVDVSLRDPSDPAVVLSSVSIPAGGHADVLVRVAVGGGLAASPGLVEGMELAVEAVPAAPLPALHVPVFYRHVLTGPAPTLDSPVLTAASASGDDVELAWSGVDDGAVGYRVEEAAGARMLFPVDTAEGLARPSDDEAWASSSGWTASTSRNHTPGGTTSWFSGQRPLLTSTFTSEPLSGATSLSFWEDVDTEEGWDFGRVVARVDGADRVLYETSGSSNGWRRVELALPAGTSTVAFRYTTDEINDIGAFAGWFVDDLAISSATYVPVVDLPAAARSAQVVDRGAGLKAYRVSALREVSGGATAPGGTSDARTVLLATIDPGVVEEGVPAPTAVAPSSGSGAPFAYRWSTGGTDRVLGHVFPQDGPQDVTVEVTAADGTTGSAAARLDVRNVAPGVTLTDLDAPHRPSDVGRIRIDVADPGADDVTVAVTFDGKPLTTVALGRERTTTVSVRYPGPGRYRVVATATDDDTSGSGAIDVVVVRKSLVV